MIRDNFVKYGEHIKKLRGDDEPKQLEELDHD